MSIKDEKRLAKPVSDQPATATNSEIIVLESKNFATDKISQALSRLGYSVTCVTTGINAIGSLKQTTEALVIDSPLTEPESAALLKQIAQRNSATIVLVLSTDGVPSAVRSIKAGADDYLQKPVSAQEVARKIEQLKFKPSTAGSPQTNLEFRKAIKDKTLDDIKTMAILDTLDLFDGDRARTARVLHISGRTIYNKLKDLGLLKNQQDSQTS